MPDQTSAHSDSTTDPFQGVAVVLLALTLLGAAAAVYGGVTVENPVLIDVAVTLTLSAGIVVGVAWTRYVQQRPPRSGDLPVVQTGVVEGEAQPPELAESGGAATRSRLSVVSGRIQRWSQDLGAIGTISVGTGALGALAILFEVNRDTFAYPLLPWPAAIAAALCLGAAALASTVVRYLLGIDPRRLPEGPALARGARIVAWILVVASASIGLAWVNQQAVVRVLHDVVLLINLSICYELVTFKPRAGETVESFPLDFPLLPVLGSRANILASILDSAEHQLGIDLRSTWALTVVRRSLEPMVVALCLVAWLSTSLTVVGVEEQGLVERLGVPVGGDPLPPGLHLHYPWPVDRALRISVRRVQVQTVGHEGQETGGPEDVLWAREHAANEYTLLLGNGRDLITVDAAVQFRIADVRAWRYHSQNPGDALRAIAYRAVMRTTVNRTLAEALSENVVTTTARMRTMVQQDADALGLGVEVLGFTVGGMHPPVLVAPAYQAVVSAELGKVTAVVNAQALRNRTVPFAESTVLSNRNAAQAQGATAEARAAGEAWSFLALQDQYRASPQDYMFRRRLETLEKGLAGRRYTIVDSRFQRDGGELWVMP